MTAKTSGQLKISAELAEKLPSEVCQCEIALHIGPDSRLYSQRFGTVDTKLSSTVADGVLIVAKDGFIPRHLMGQAQESQRGQSILGIVLNRIDPDQACFTSHYDHSSAGSGARVKQEVKSLTLASLGPKSLPAAGRHCSDSLRASALHIYLPSVRHTHRLGAAA